MKAKAILTIVSFLILCSFVHADDTQILNDNNEIYLKMEESSSPLNDSNPNQINATCTNCPTFQQPGIIGFAPHLDGTNDEFRTIANTKMNSGTDNFTFCIWLKFDDLTATRNLYGQWSNTPFIQCAFYSSTKSIGLNMYTHAGSNFITYSNDDTIADTNWHYFCYVRTGNFTAEIWIDGVNETLSITTAGAAQSLDEDQWYIGSLGDGGVEMDGYIDEFSYFSIALTPSQILFLYNSGSPGSAQQYSFADTINPSITNIICTSADPHDTTEPYRTPDNTPTFTLDTDEDANCAINGTICSTTGALSHTCTQPTELSEYDVMVRFNCTDGCGNENITFVDVFVDPVITYEIILNATSLTIAVEETGDRITFLGIGLILVTVLFLFAYLGRNADDMGIKFVLSSCALGGCIVVVNIARIIAIEIEVSDQFEYNIYIIQWLAMILTGFMIVYTVFKLIVATLLKMGKLIRVDGKIKWNK